MKAGIRRQALGKVSMRKVRDGARSGGVANPLVAGMAAEKDLTAEA